ncbi:hypothetical protein, partial [Pseudomonas syringae group genomosp. 3]
IHTMDNEPHPKHEDGQQRLTIIAKEFSMLKSILFHVTPKLQKLEAIALSCGVILLFGYVLISMILHLMDVEIEQSRLVDGIGPFIFIAIVISSVCMLLHMMIKASPIQIEAQITVEGKKLTEAQSKAVRIALRELSNAGQTIVQSDALAPEGAHASAPRAAEVLKLIMQK